MSRVVDFDSPECQAGCAEYPPSRGWRQQQWQARLISVAILTCLADSVVLHSVGLQPETESLCLHLDLLEATVGITGLRSDTSEIPLADGAHVIEEKPIAELLGKACRCGESGAVGDPQLLDAELLQGVHGLR